MRVYVFFNVKSALADTLVNKFQTDKVKSILERKPTKKTSEEILKT